jgi:hypothetical protein
MIGFHELIDLAANNINTSFVGRIQVDDIFFMFTGGRNIARGDSGFTGDVGAYSGSRIHWSRFIPAGE